MVLRSNMTLAASVKQVGKVRDSLEEVIQLTIVRRISAGLIAPAMLLLILAAPAWSAPTRSQVTMLINEGGAVEVVDRWSGLKQAEGVFNYFSAAREVGVIPVTVKNHGFTISFATRSYLRYEEGDYYFVTPDFYYEDGQLDVELALTYPPNLVVIESRPAPDYSGEGVMQWSITDAAHTVVLVRFERVGPFVQPGRSGPDWQVNPAGLSQLSAEELPTSADDVLKELQNIIAVARSSDATDQDFLRVMDKLLSKFYYLFSVSGMLLDYDASGAGDAAGDVTHAAYVEPVAEEPPPERVGGPQQLW